MKELSDKNRPKKLEDIFREGMEAAEMAPSDLLWSRIDKNLDSKETGYYKERLVWHQRLAAACVVLVLCAGAYLFFDARQHNNPPAIARQESGQAPETGPAAPQRKALASPPAPVSQPVQRAANNAAVQGGTDAEAPGTQQAIGHLAGTMPVSSRKVVQAGHRLIQTTPPNLQPANTAEDAAAGVLPITTALPENINTSDRAGSGFGKISTFTQTLAGDYELALMKPSWERPTRTGISPDSLAPVFIWPGQGQMAALQDSMPQHKLTLATAPAMVEGKKAEKDKPGSRWRFGGKYASQYFDQNIALNQTQPAAPANAMVPSSLLPFASPGASSYADALKEFDKETGSGFSFNTGISAAYQLNKHLDLETGLGYTQNVATTNTSYIFNNAQIGSRYAAISGSDWSKDAYKNAAVVTGIPSTAFLATLAGGATLNHTAVTKTQAFDTQYRYRLLGIPVKLSYQTNRGKSFYFASMGMLSNLLVKANIVSDSDRVPDLQYNPNARDSPFRNWHFAAVASAGKGFEIAQGLQLKAGLEATQYLTNLTINPDYLNGKQRKPYTLGLVLSSSYTFGK
jgi:hypothetical protein